LFTQVELAEQSAEQSKEDVVQRFAKCLVSLGAAVAIVTCSDSTAPNVAGTAHILRGASTGAGPRAPGLNALATKGRAALAATPSGGHWYLTPDQGKVTIVSLSFIDTTGSPHVATMTSCEATYTRTGTSLSPLLDCPFTLDAGTYSEVDVGISNTFQVLINDPAHGIFTDAASSTGLTSTAPAGGANFAPLTIPVSGDANGIFTTQSLFTTPLVVDSASPPAVNLIVDMIHTVLMNVSGSTLTFDTSLPQPAVHITPLVGGVGRAEFYSASGTADNVNAGVATTGNAATSVRVYYDVTGTPVDAFSPVVGPSEAWNATPAAGATKFTAGGYLGLDPTGTLCWALPATYTYQQYAYLKSMRPASTVGASTILFSMQTTTAPAPTSGKTYASGCPRFIPDASTSLVLVAK
jgi:hypothetical protein